MKNINIFKILFVFVLAFIFNLIWENWHAQLYVHYKGDPITEAVLLQATLVDACIISLLAFGYFFIKWIKERYSLVFLLGVLIAIGIEWFALSTSRWSYTNMMPVVPIIKTGITPTVQLGFLGCLSIYFVNRVLSKYRLS